MFARPSTVIVPTKRSAADSRNLPIAPKTADKMLPIAPADDAKTWPTAPKTPNTQSTITDIEVIAAILWFSDRDSTFNFNLKQMRTIVEIKTALRCFTWVS